MFERLTPASNPKFDHNRNPKSKSSTVNVTTAVTVTVSVTTAVTLTVTLAMIVTVNTILTKGLYIQNTHLFQMLPLRIKNK